MNTLEGKTILVTGPAGQIAFPLASRLALNNTVWGLARFSDPATRERCEKAGITTAVVDLAEPDWTGLPERVDYLLPSMDLEVVDGGVFAPPAWPLATTTPEDEALAELASDHRLVWLDLRLWRR